MSSTQTALVIAAPLAPFKLAQIPIYSPGRGELLIKIHTAALNPADWKLQKYGLVITEFPAVLGIDHAGEVVEVGEGIEDFKKGDRVVARAGFIENKFQSFQQYTLAKAHLTTKLPSNMTYDQAATILSALCTAISGLFAEFPHGAGFPAPFTPEGRNFGAGKVLLVIGGSSSVGQYAIQVAVLAGFSTIIATASLKNESLLTAQGATHVVDRSLDASSLISAIASITSIPVVAIFDAIGLTSTESLGIAVLSHWHTKTGEKGILISVAGQVSDIVKEATSIKAASIWASAALPWNEKLYSTMFRDKLSGWLENGDIKPNQVEVLKGGLTAIPGGLERLENNQVSGLKLVVHPHETV